MSEDLDALVSEIQTEIDQETQEQYGEAFLIRWQNPKFLYEMQNPSTQASLLGSCGDRINIYLRIERERIIEASFTTSGCGASIVCGSTACELALNRELEEAAALEDKDILEILGGLPEEHEHCAHLAAQTLRQAISQYWKEQKGTKNAES